jgi:outer membrane protein assembly factor BamB
MLTERLFIGISGSIVCLDPASGGEVWRQKLNSSGIATVAIVGDGLYGAAAGELCRLDPLTGRILWRNKLPGLGLGVISFPAGSEAGAHAAAAHAKQHAAI